MNKRKHEVYNLAICENGALIVMLMFTLASTEGYGAQRIANRLYKVGIKNRSGNNWHPAIIRGMLRNILYTGILRGGGSRSEVIPELQIIDIPKIFLNFNHKFNDKPENLCYSTLRNKE